MAELAVTAVHRDGQLVEITTADGTLRRQIAVVDTVISVAPQNYKKVNNLYYDLANGRLVIVYEP